MDGDQLDVDRVSPTILPSDTAFARAVVRILSTAISLIAGARRGGVHSRIVNDPCVVDARLIVLVQNLWNGKSECALHFVASNWFGLDCELGIMLARDQGCHVKPISGPFL